MSILLHPILSFLFSFVFIGMAIKFLDEIQDGTLQNLKGTITPWLIGILVAILVVYWAFFDFFTAMIAIALILGLAVTRKIDSIYFLIIVILTFPVAFLSIFRVEFFSVGLPLLLILIPTIGLDEFLDEKASDIESALLRWILHRRPVLKIVVLLLPLIGLLTFLHSAALWTFDIAYELVAYLLRASESFEKGDVVSLDGGF